MNNYHSSSVTSGRTGRGGELMTIQQYAGKDVKYPFAKGISTEVKYRTLYGDQAKKNTKNSDKNKPTKSSKIDGSKNRVNYKAKLDARDNLHNGKSKSKDQNLMLNKSYSRQKQGIISYNKTNHFDSMSISYSQSTTQPNPSHQHNSSIQTFSTPSAKMHPSIKQSKILTDKPGHPHHQPPVRILSPHNSPPPSSYPATLFPPNSQSLKAQLQQNVQQQMLNNYYINRYSKIMSKMTNQEVKVELPDYGRRSLENTLDRKASVHSKSNNKRKNFKQLINKKNNISGIQKHNSSLTKREMPTSHNPNDMIDRLHNDSQLNNSYDQQQSNNNKQDNHREQPNQFMTLTFSPQSKLNHNQLSLDKGKHSFQLKRASQQQNGRSDQRSANKKSNKQKGQDRQRNQSKSVNKSVGKNRQYISLPNQQQEAQIYQSKQQSSRRKSPLKDKTFISDHRKHLVSPIQVSPSALNYKSSPKKLSPSPSRSVSLTNAHHHYSHISPSLSKPQHPLIVPPIRNNFKQSFIQKRALNMEYDHNYELYKKLQSSIINELYSPSPKRIQSEGRRIKQIILLEREMTEEEANMANDHDSNSRRMNDKSRLNRENLEMNQKNQVKNEQPFQNVSIYEHWENDGQDQQQQQTAQRQYKNRHSNPYHSNRLLSVPNHQCQLKLIRSSIRSSINRQANSNQSSRSLSSTSSPYKAQFPSKRSPSQSPRRSLMAQKYLIKLQKQISPQWDLNFAQSGTKRYKSSSLEERKDKKREGTSISKNKIGRDNKYGRNLQIKQELEEFDHDIDHNNLKENENINATGNALSYNQVAKKFGSSVNLNIYQNQNDDGSNNQQQKATFSNHQRRASFDSRQKEVKTQIPGNQRYYQSSNFNSNQSVNEPSKEQNEDIQFIPAATLNPFELPSSVNSSSHYAQHSLQLNNSPSSRINQAAEKNHPAHSPQTRSRKPSDQLSFISDYNPSSLNPHNQLSILSRFSMTSEEGSMIIQKLEEQITQNEFGPYQYALQSLRDLLMENKNAWPIYVVGQRILDDRAEYEKKIELQGKMIKDYEEKVGKLREVERERQKGRSDGGTQSEKIESNKYQILQLIRQLSSQAN